MTLLSNEGGMGITADNELYRPRSAMFCHPERELRVSRDGQTDASLRSA
jgi:hypothetical protein